MRDQLKSAGAASAIKAKAELAASRPPSILTETEKATTTVVKKNLEVEMGPGVLKTDDELVDMLRRKPKSVPEIHNRESFRRFFTGFPRTRFLTLLQKADAMKRLELVEDLLL
jgi:hypothetical protein